MHMLKPGGTREQAAVAAWLNVANQMRLQLLTVNDTIPSLISGFDAWTIATSHFGECELYARALDRATALDVFHDRHSWLASAITRHNKAGLQFIEEARKTLPAFRRELAMLKPEVSRVAEVLKEFEPEIRERLAEWDMKGSDAKKLMEKFVEAAGLVQSSGLGSLPDYLDRTLADLYAGRLRADRGNYDNMPWWKWMLLAGAVGWTVAYAIVSAIARGDVMAKVKIGYAVIEVSHFVAFVAFC